MNAGARGKRPPVGPEGLRRRARAAFGASLALMFGATAALGGEVTGVTFASTPTDEYYNAGEMIRIDVDFDENVTITGAPTFSLTVGRRARTMAYDADASDADTLRFNYSVVDGDVDDDGVSYGSDALRGGRIESGSPPAVSGPDRHGNRPGPRAPRRCQQAEGRRCSIDLQPRSGSGLRHRGRGGGHGHVR